VGALILISITLMALGLVFNLVALASSKRRATDRFRRTMLGGALACLIAAPIFLLAAIS